jgi:hypothetical protein
MKLGIIAGLVVVGVAAAIFLVGGAGAVEYTSQVIPKVNVASGGTFSIVGGTTGPTNNWIDFDSLGPGTSQTKTLTLGVTANGAWQVTVATSRDLKDDTTGNSIASSSFTFTSNGPAGPTYKTSATEFGLAATPASVVTNGSAVTGCNFNVVYKLDVPASQPPGYYTAPFHTYTLIVSGS